MAIVDGSAVIAEVFVKVVEVHPGRLCLPHGAWPTSRSTIQCTGNTWSLPIRKECETPDNGSDNDNTSNVKEIAKASFQLFPNPGPRLGINAVCEVIPGAERTSRSVDNVFNADGRLVEQLSNAVPSGLNVWTFDASLDCTSFT